MSLFRWLDVIYGILHEKFAKCWQLRFYRENDGTKDISDIVFVVGFLSIEGMKKTIPLICEWTKDVGNLTFIDCHILSALLMSFDPTLTS